jgi:hypothetical protein
MNRKLGQFILQSNREAAAGVVPATDVAPWEVMALGQRGGHDNLLRWGGEQRRCVRWGEGGERRRDSCHRRWAACRDSSFPLDFFNLSWIIKYFYIFLMIFYYIRNFLIWLVLF